MAYKNFLYNILLNFTKMTHNTKYNTHYMQYISKFLNFPGNYL